MNIVEATQSYETWLAARTPSVQTDLDLKHKRMRKELFPFLRATYYRWIQRFNEVCPELCDAPKLLAVGDLHVENYGTWRDADGRLVWGINDFDEAYHDIPYTNDLVRLAVSALIAIVGSGSPLWSEPKLACKAIISGYRDALQSGGAPFVLAEKHLWLRNIATERLKDPLSFWTGLDGLKDYEGDPPLDAHGVLQMSLPADAPAFRLCTRVGGLGSLGRARFAAIADYQGGKIAREAKAIVPSAHEWAAPPEDAGQLCLLALNERAVRCRDPFLHADQNWVVRRLAPDCSRIELSDLPKKRDELKLLAAMAFECGNVHLGSSAASDKRAAPAESKTKSPAGLSGVKPESDIERHLSSLSKGWLLEAAGRMLTATEKDWKEWRKFQKSKS